MQVRLGGQEQIQETLKRTQYAIDALFDTITSISAGNMIGLALVWLTSAFLSVRHAMMSLSNN